MKNPNSETNGKQERNMTNQAKYWSKFFKASIKPAPSRMYSKVDGFFAGFSMEERNESLKWQK